MSTAGENERLELEQLCAHLPTGDGTVIMGALRARYRHIGDQSERVVMVVTVSFVVWAFFHIKETSSFAKRNKARYNFIEAKKTPSRLFQGREGGKGPMTSRKTYSPMTVIIAGGNTE